MQLDIRLPIGLMFLVLGPLLLVWGVVDHAAITRNTGGAMIAPIRVNLSIASRCPSCRGASRGTTTKRRRSFRTTSAALVRRLSPRPCAIAARVRIEQGTTIMPSVLKEPLAMGAARSWGEWVWLASDVS